jgi:hypothetical protein
VKQYADGALYEGELNEKHQKQGMGKYQYPNGDMYNC